MNCNSIGDKSCVESIVRVHVMCYVLFIYVMYVDKILSSKMFCVVHLDEFFHLHILNCLLSLTGL